MSKTNNQPMPLNSPLTREIETAVAGFLAASEGLLLAELMATWEALAIVIQDVEGKIQEQVMALGQTVVVGRCRATYSGGRGQYDYEGLAKQLEPPKYIVDQHTVPKVDWMGVCKDVSDIRELDWDALREKHYTPGKTVVNVKLDPPKKGK